MAGRDPRSVEHELFMRSKTHAKSAIPRQPWEQPGLLCVFNPVQAAFPMSLSIPYQGSSPSQASLPSDPQHVPVQDLTLATPGQAWTRAVKAKRGPGPADKRAEAYRRVLALLHAFASFFDLCELMADDTTTGYDSLDAILAAKATTTILKRMWDHCEYSVNGLRNLGRSLLLLRRWFGLLSTAFLKCRGRHPLRWILHYVL